jgi:pimeloyl-ACP methyl ester carboxylesterase
MPIAISTVVLAPLAAAGIASLALAAALATPLRSPPPLASIHQGAMVIDRTGLPELSRFQARDGTWLAYRFYPATNGAKDRLAIVAHGSSASSDEMHVVARALAENGVAAVAIDARGHGASGARGDIGYLGQLDDDLADLLAHLRKSYPDAKLDLIGHSAGGGFAMRIAGGPLGKEFDRFVALAPYLGYRAPTNRPNDGAGRWVSADYPRVIALALLNRLGNTWAQGLPTLAFANAPEAAMFVTNRYSFRLMANYTSPLDWQAPFTAAAGKVVVIAGENDELMDAPAYKPALEPLGAKVTLVPGVDHMGIVHQPAALAAIVAAAK